MCRRDRDVSKLEKLGWKYHTELEEGIRLAYEDFLHNPMPVSYTHLQCVPEADLVQQACQMCGEPSGGQRVPAESIVLKAGEEYSAESWRKNRSPSSAKKLEGLLPLTLPAPGGAAGKDEAAGGDGKADLLGIHMACLLYTSRCV